MTKQSGRERREANPIRALYTKEFLAKADASRKQKKAEEEIRKDLAKAKKR